MSPGYRVLVSAAVLCLAALGCGDSSPRAPGARTFTPAPATVAAATGSPDTREVLRYVALGDSLASGMGGEPSYADFYARDLQRRTRVPVELTNLGRPGWTSAQLLEALRSSDMFRHAVAQADVVTWDIGANDIIRATLRVGTGTCGGTDDLRCVRETTRDFATRWDAVVDELVALRRDSDVPLRTFDLYRPFIPPEARTDEILAQLGAMNATITASAQRDGVEVAAVADAFTGSFDELLDADGLHPSRQGHRLIARLLLGLGVPLAD